MGQEHVMTEVTEGANGEPAPEDVVDFSALAPDETSVLPITVTIKPHEDPPRTRPRCCLVGFTNSRIETPWDDQRYEIWGMNGLYVHKDCKRFDRWFDMHKPDVIPQDRVDAYRAMGRPVYLQQARADLTMSITYPKAEVEDLCGTYMTSSVSWMLGKAMVMGFEVIELYGIDLSQDTEYRYQRASLEYLIGLARGKGFDVRVVAHSDLMSATHQYGYEHDSGFRKRVKERVTEFETRIQECTDAITQHTAEVRRLEIVRATIDGSRQDAQWTMQRLVADHTSMVPDAAQAGVPTAGG